MRSVTRRSSSFHFRSVRPSLLSSDAHLTAALYGAIAVGAMLPPTPPFIRLHSLIKHIQKKHPFVWRFEFFDVNLRQQFTTEKRTRAPLYDFARKIF